MRRYFLKYNGEYKKTEYDIKLFDGNIYRNCWPNAGIFHTKCGKIILGEDVEYFKISNSNYGLE